MIPPIVHKLMHHILFITIFINHITTLCGFYIPRQSCIGLNIPRVRHQPIKLSYFSSHRRRHSIVLHVATLLEAYSSTDEDDTVNQRKASTDHIGDVVRDNIETSSAYASFRDIASDPTTNPSLHVCGISNYYDNDGVATRRKLSPPSDFYHINPFCAVSYNNNNNNNEMTATELSHPQQNDNNVSWNAIPHQVDTKRRNFLLLGLSTLGGTACFGMTMINHKQEELEALKRIIPTISTFVTTTKCNGRTTTSSGTYKGTLVPINVTEMALQTNVHVTIKETNHSYIGLNHTTFQKYRMLMNIPAWIPSRWIPPPTVIKDTTNQELLLAAIIAGSVNEVIRTMILHPIKTLKTRIQNDVTSTMTIKSNDRNKSIRMIQDGNNNDHSSESCIYQNDNEDEDMSRVVMTNDHTYVMRKTRAHFHSIDARNVRRHVQIIQRKLETLQWNIIQHIREGNLYSGIIPSVLISVPTAGLYYGIRDVVKRMLMVSSIPHLSEFWIVMIAVFIADVVSLAFHTPVDTLTTRLQVLSSSSSQASSSQSQRQKLLQQLEEDPSIWLRDTANDDDDFEVLTQKFETSYSNDIGDWFIETMERLPWIILTDLPYLLLRITFNYFLLRDKVLDIGHYGVVTIITAMICGFITTPFDVLRTRMLLIHNDKKNGNKIPDGNDNDHIIHFDMVGKNNDDSILLHTFHSILHDGNDHGSDNNIVDISNLFAGWLERTIYLGISGAWIPCGLLLYNAIRDCILLEIFQ